MNDPKQGCVLVIYKFEKEHRLITSIFFSLSRQYELFMNSSSRVLSRLERESRRGKDYYFVRSKAASCFGMTYKHSTLGEGKDKIEFEKREKTEKKLSLSTQKVYLKYQYKAVTSKILGKHQRTNPRRKQEIGKYCTVRNNGSSSLQFLSKVL